MQALGVIVLGSARKMVSALPLSASFFLLFTLPPVHVCIIVTSSASVPAKIAFNKNKNNNYLLLNYKHRVK